MKERCGRRLKNNNLTPRSWRSIRLQIFDPLLLELCLLLRQFCSDKCIQHYYHTRGHTPTHGIIDRRTLNRYTEKDHYRILQYFSPLPRWRHQRFTVQITGFPEYFSKPQGAKTKDFAAGRSHLLYFVVVPESLTWSFHCTFDSPRIF